MFSTAEDILMIASLVYYPTVCVCRLKDRWDQPLAWSWEYMVVVGLTCAYLVA
jgi:hypothetical protein